MSDVVRLSVNLNPETALALRTIAADRGISITEAIRRSIGIYKLVHDETQAGHSIHIVDGAKTSELIIL